MKKLILKNYSNQMMINYLKDYLQKTLVAHPKNKKNKDSNEFFKSRTDRNQ